MSHIALAPANYAELEQAQSTPIEESGWDELFDYIEFEPKMCFNNTAKVMMNNPDKELLYVIGYACGGNLETSLYVAHAWIETNDGMILDPTFDLAEVHGIERDPQTYTYFARIKFTYAEFEAYLEDMERLKGSMFAPDHDNIKDDPELAAKMLPFEECDGLTRMINHVGHEELGWDQAERRFKKDGVKG